MLKKLFFLSIISLTGCGYTLQGSGSILPPDVRKIHIPPVENSSTETALGNLMTESLVDRFERFGVVSVVDDINESDAILKVRILKVSRSTKTVTSQTDTAQQFDTTVTIAAELKRVTGAVLWRNPNFVVSRDYAASSGTVVSSSADFAGSSITSSDLNSLDPREIAREQQGDVFNNLADQVSKKIYDEAVAPDF